MIDPQYKEAPCLIALHMIEDRDNVPWSDISTAKPRGPGIDHRRPFDFRIARRPGQGIGESRLDFSRKRIGLRRGIIHALDHGKRFKSLERFDDLRSWKRTEAGNVQRADFCALMLAQIFRGGAGGLDHASHADDRVFGIIQCITVDHAIAASGQRIKLVHHPLGDRRDALVKIALRDFPLHVAILILHNAAHDRMHRVHQISQAVLAARVADELFHQLGLGQTQTFNCMGCQKAVLNIEIRRLRLFGDAPRDQREIGALLDVAREQHAPAAIGNAHHVIMSGVNI